MKTSNKQLKENARIVQSLKWNSSACITCIFILIVDLMSSFVSFLTVNNALLASILSVISTLVVSLLTWMLLSGYIYYFMNIARGVPSSAMSIFSIFKMQPDKYIILGMFYSLSELVLTIPNFIMLFSGKVLNGTNLLIYLSWSAVRILILYFIILNIVLAPMLLLDNPNMEAFEALRISHHFMKGNKFRLFRLHLSFIGWIILGLLSLLLGFLYIIPYITAAHVQFYLDLTCHDD